MMKIMLTAEIGLKDAIDAIFISRNDGFSTPFQSLCAPHTARSLTVFPRWSDLEVGILPRQGHFILILPPM